MKGRAAEAGRLTDISPDLGLITPCLPSDHLPAFYGHFSSEVAHTSSLFAGPVCRTRADNDLLILYFGRSLPILASVRELAELPDPQDALRTRLFRLVLEGRQ